MWTAAPWPSCVPLPTRQTSNARPMRPVRGDSFALHNSPRQDTLRATSARGVVRFLQAQYSERDGKTRRLVPAMFGIFGHGNVCGLGQALEQCGQDLPYYQPCNEQSMVHTAIGFA